MLTPIVCTSCATINDPFESVCTRCQSALHVQGVESRLHQDPSELVVQSAQESLKKSISDRVPQEAFAMNQPSRDAFSGNTDQWNHIEENKAQYIEQNEDNVVKNYKWKEDSIPFWNERESDVEGYIHLTGTKTNIWHSRIVPEVQKIVHESPALQKLNSQLHTQTVTKGRSTVRKHKILTVGVLAICITGMLLIHGLTTSSIQDSAPKALGSWTYDEALSSTMGTTAQSLIFPKGMPHNSQFIQGLYSTSDAASATTSPQTLLYIAVQSPLITVGTLDNAFTASLAASDAQGFSGIGARITGMYGTARYYCQNVTDMNLSVNGIECMWGEGTVRGLTLWMTPSQTTIEEGESIVSDAIHATHS